MATRARARAAGAAPARTRRGRARRPRFARAASTRTVDVYWDLDNLCPKSATAAVVFERVLAAGAAFGRVNHPGARVRERSDAGEVGRGRGVAGRGG